MSDDADESHEPEPAEDTEATVTEEAAVATEVRKRRFSLRRNRKARGEKKPKNDKPVAVKAPKQIYEPLSARIWMALLVVAAVVTALLVLVLTNFF